MGSRENVVGVGGSSVRTWIALLRDNIADVAFAQFAALGLL